MAIFRIGAVVLLAAGAPLGAKAENYISCSDLISFSKGIGPLIGTISHMLEWCEERVPNDPSCNELLRVGRENNLGHHAQAVALKAVSLGLECPVEE